LNVGNESALPKSNQDKEANAITSKCPHYSHDSCLLVLMDAWAARVVMPLMLPRLFFVIGGSFAGAVMTSLTFS
jgi:hypothetical protein